MVTLQEILEQARPVGDMCTHNSITLELLKNSTRLDTLLITAPFHGIYGTFTQIMGRNGTVFENMGFMGRLGTL